MNILCTPAQQRVIDALIAITGLDPPSFALLDEGPRVTITYDDGIFILEKDGTVSDSNTLLRRDTQAQERTLLDAIELDDRLNREERCPTGDDYNTVMALVRDAFRYGPLITFDAEGLDAARRLLAFMKGGDLTLNGSRVQLEAADYTSLIVRDWAPQKAALGAPRVIAWAAVKTIHVH